MRSAVLYRRPLSVPRSSPRDRFPRRRTRLHRRSHKPSAARSHRQWTHHRPIMRSVVPFHRPLHLALPLSKTNRRFRRPGSVRFRLRSSRLPCRLRRSLVAVKPPEARSHRRWKHHRPIMRSAVPFRRPLRPAPRSSPRVLFPHRFRRLRLCRVLPLKPCRSTRRRKLSADTAAKNARRAILRGRPFSFMAAGREESRE